MNTPIKGMRVENDGINRHIIAEGGVYVAKVSSLPLAHQFAASGEVMDCLARIMADLPSRRDWLDPVLEAEARAALALSKGES